VWGYERICGRVKHDKQNTKLSLRETVTLEMRCIMGLRTKSDTIAGVASKEPWEDLC
jgi:hypothetical protein